MAGYWPSSVFLMDVDFISFLVFIDRNDVEVQNHAKKKKKKKTRPISSHLDRKSLVNKGFIVWDKTPKTKKKIFDLAGPSEKSRAGSLAPSCPLG